jgi:hypothetical protein
MFGTKVLSTKLGRVLAITPLIAAASLPNPGSPTAQSVAAGKIIPHMLEVPDQNDQVRNFQGLTRTKGLIMLFSRSLAW